jgi:flavin-dependent dehydrogenase
MTQSPDPLVLQDGARIAVVGGGPSGAFFSIFALKMARILGRELQVTIFEPRDFTATGPAGCNRCGGIISELLIQLLAVEGINLPDTVVRKGINSYRLHTAHGSVFIVTPQEEKTIATVSRGGGPRGLAVQEKESFDQFLLSQAVREGAAHERVLIDGLSLRDGRPVLSSRQRELMQADLVVGAFGVKSSSAGKLFEGLGFGYAAPSVISAAIAEIAMDPGQVAELFGNSIHLFLLPEKNIKFAAMIPKGAYVTLCILGRNVTADTAEGFLRHPVVEKVLPPSAPHTLQCRCLPKMNVGAPAVAVADRIVMIGDAGSTRLFKDGLGAAYLMGKAAARTAVFEGVGKKQLVNGYLPVYRGIIRDNWFGRYLYAVTDVYRRHRFLTRGLLGAVRDEQERPPQDRIVSSVLWDMFTGNERYRSIFPRTLSIPMRRHVWKAFAQAVTGGT